MRIGIDLGGTKTEIIALGAGGVELLRRRAPTEPTYEGTLALIHRMVEAAESELGSPGTVGIGIPGAISPATGLVKNANSTWLIGEALDRDLEARLGREVRVMNDANCFTLSEASDGAGAGAASVFGVILGTGVGGGIVLDGRIVEGAGLIAGEWGHIPLPVSEPGELPGPGCYCGRSGCVESWLSGPGMAADHERRTGERRTAREIATGAAGGSGECLATLDRWRRRLSRALAVVVNILDPEVIVLGGGLSNLPGLAEDLPALLAPHLFSDALVTEVRRNRHGDSSGVRGAARLWSEEEALRNLQDRNGTTEGS